MGQKIGARVNHNKAHGMLSKELSLDKHLKAIGAEKAILGVVMPKNLRVACHPAIDTRIRNAGINGLVASNRQIPLPDNSKISYSAPLAFQCLASFSESLSLAVILLWSTPAPSI